MSALTVIGTVVSVDLFVHPTKKTATGQPMQITTHWIVNGSGEPIGLKNMGPALFDVGKKVQVQVKASVFNNAISFMPEDRNLPPAGVKG